MFDITFQEKGGRRKRLDFEGESCIIGSDKKSDFLINQRGVAKQHASISFDRTKGVLLTPLEKKAAIWLNREKLTRVASVAEQDEIVVGDITIWVHPKVKPELAIAMPGKASAMPDIVPPVLNERVQPSSSNTEVKAEDADFAHWCHVVHQQLLSQMDLRRKNVHTMSDDDLRIETESIVDSILLTLAGTMPVAINKERIKINVLNEAIGLGPLEKFLVDDDVTEIMVNGFDEVFVEKKGRLIKSEYTFSSNQSVLAVIERIITPIGRRIDESSPMVDARLKDGSRVNAIIPPLALKGPSLTIRKFPKNRLYFSDLVGFGSVSQEMVDFLKICVESHKNIIVSGGTGSGKTTLLNVLSSFIPDSERIITVEDAAELKLDQPNLVSLESKPPNLEGKGAIPIRDLVKNTLRMRPDRIVVGECRGGEALDMLQAMNTGHDGSLTTAHANMPRDLISRIEVMVMMAGMDLPMMAIREQIASAVHIIVQQTRYPCGSRKISKITEVVGMESGTVQLQDIFEYQRSGYDEDGKIKGHFTACGFVPTFYEELRAAGVDLDISIFRESDEVQEVF